MSDLHLRGQGNDWDNKTAARAIGNRIATGRMRRNDNRSAYDKPDIGYAAAKPDTNVKSFTNADAQPDINANSYTYPHANADPHTNPHNRRNW